VVGASSSNTNLLGRGKKVTTVYGTARDGNGAPMGDVWVKLTQGSNWAMAQTGHDGFYVFFDGQGCSAGDGLAGGCGAGSVWNFASGSVSTKLEILGSDPGTPAPGPTYPTGTSKALVTGTGCPLGGCANFTAPALPSFTFTVAKSSAYHRDWRFTT
jgi:hypothetical protein